MSDGRLEKMDKDFSPQVDALLPETEALAKVKQSFFFFEIHYLQCHLARQDKRSFGQVVVLGKTS